MVFLKTHKTGSSTVTNILNRFGERNHLVFVVPTEKQNRLGWPWFFQEEHMIHYNNTKPNMLCSHSRYNRAVLDRVMPTDTIYVTILRDPVTQFESTFSYMTFGEILGISNETDPLEAFFENPKDVLMNYILTQDLRINSDRLKLIRNGMFFDLGLESKDFNNMDEIRRKVQRLDREFHFVMLMEYFDESLIMLKNLLCWDMDDIVYFHHNQRRTTQKRNTNLVKDIQQWSHADTVLYDYFKDKFLHKLRQQNEDFFHDITDLRTRNAVLRDICLNSTPGNDEGYQDVDIKGFKIWQNLTEPLKTMCDKMTWNEVRYLGYLRYKQRKQLPATNTRTFRDYVRTWVPFV